MFGSLSPELWGDDKKPKFWQLALEESSSYLRQNQETPRNWILDVAIEQLDQAEPEANIGPGFPITCTFKFLLLRSVWIDFSGYIWKMHFLSFSLDFSSISDHSVQLFPGSSSFSFGLYDGVPQGLTLLSFTNWMTSVCHVFQIHYTIYQLCSISYLSQKSLSVNKFETEPSIIPSILPLVGIPCLR